MAEFIKIYSDNPNESAIAKVVKVLKEGGLVIYQQIRFMVWVAI